MKLLLSYQIIIIMTILLNFNVDHKGLRTDEEAPRLRPLPGCSI